MVTEGGASPEGAEDSSSMVVEGASTSWVVSAAGGVVGAGAVDMLGWIRRWVWGVGGGCRGWKGRRELRRSNELEKLTATTSGDKLRFKSLFQICKI